MNAWFAQFTQLVSPYFVNPAYVLPGAALVASPIIIHLINRLRFRRLRFAAMEFLLQSQARNRRRLRMEQLLLLLLRILIVLALLALIARLILDPSQISLFRGATVHHLVLLDDSGSMRNRWGDTTAFDEALDIVRKLVAEGERRPNTQKLTLLALSDPDHALFGIGERDVNEALVQELDVKLQNLKCTHRSFDLAAGLEAARKLLLEDKATIKHLHVISDFRESDWVNQKALGSAVRAADAAGIAVNLVKTVSEHTANLAVTELSGDVQVAAAGVPLRLKVAVKNFDDQPAENVRLSVMLDGRKLPRSIVFDKIEAGDEVSREFDVVLHSPGKHAIQVGLPGDALEADNSRYLAVDVPASHDVLIIDGDPTGESGSYVSDALPPFTGFAPLVDSVDYLRKNSLEKFCCIYLVNVPEMPPDAIDPLEDFVAGGGGLVWFVGGAVKPAFYNDKLYRSGKGLFPVPLSSTRRELHRDDETNPGPDLNFRPHPVFERIFKDQDNPFVDSVHIHSYLPVAETWVRDDNQRKDGVSTIALLRNRQPLMFEHTFGKGRIVTCLTSVDAEWNDWAPNPSFVVVQLEIVKHIVRNDRTLERRVVGEVIDLSLDPAVYTGDVEISAPDSTGERITRLKAAPPTAKKDSPDTPLAAKPPASTSGVQLVAVYPQTDEPGVYRVKLRDQNQVRPETWIAYNVPIEESDLQLAANKDIRKRIGEDVRVQIREPGMFHWIQGKDAGQEVRRLLLVLLVLILLAEQMLAYKLSYHPHRAGASA